VYELDISVSFCGKPIGFEEFLNRMVEALSITIIDRRSKEEALVKWKTKT